MLIPIDLYISYDRHDEALCQELKTHLSPLERAGLIRRFDAQAVPAGEDWRKVIGAKLAAAHIVLVLVTPKYLNSNTRYDLELTPALSMFNAGKNRVIPILVKHATWEVTPLSQLALLPRNRVPIMAWTDRDAAWKDVISGIRDVIETRGAARVMSAPAFAPAPVYPIAPPSSHVPSVPSGFVPRQQPSRAAWKWVGFLLPLLLLTIALVSFRVLGQSSSELSDAKGPPSTKPGATSASPAVVTSDPSRSTVDRETCGSPCCGGESCPVDQSNGWKTEVCPQSSPWCNPCASERACIPGACSDVLSPAQAYTLRLAHALIDGREVSDQGDVCVRRTSYADEWSCFPYADAMDRRGPRPRGWRPALRPMVTAGDMMFGKGLDIAIREGQTVVASGSGIANDSIGVTALCRGLKFKVPLVPQRAGGRTEVMFYLDDP